jgi:hypothetical protein
MCFGGGSKTSIQTSQPFSGDMVGKYNDLLAAAQNKYNTPRSYSAPTAAGLNSVQQSAIDALYGSADNPILRDYASGKYIDPGTNPYYQKMTGALTDQANSQFRDTARGIDTRFNNRGFWDSSAHASTMDRAADTVNENLANALANMNYNAYNTNVGQFVQANNMLDNKYQNLLSAGNTVYGVENNQLQSAYKKWLDEQGLADNAFSQYMYAVGLGKNPSQTTTEKNNPGLIDWVGAVAPFF